MLKPQDPSGSGARASAEEGRMISARTKAALAAAKRRGVQLGGYNKNPMSRNAHFLLGLGNRMSGYIWLDMGQ